MIHRGTPTREKQVSCALERALQRRHLMYREAEFVERCDICLEPATAACDRCERPFCQRHAPVPETLCASCEREFVRRAASVAAVMLEQWECAFLLAWSTFLVKATTAVLATVGTLLGIVWLESYLRSPSPDHLGLGILGLILFGGPLLVIGIGCAVYVIGGRLRYRYLRRRFLRGEP